MSQSSQSSRTGEGQQRHSHQQTSHARGLYASSWDGLLLPATGSRPHILPEHEHDYPATDAVRAAIADWDGSSGGAHDIGQLFTSPVNGQPYPSWRIRDIGLVMRLDADTVADGEAAGAPDHKPVDTWRDPTGLFARPVKHPAKPRATEEGADAMATPRIGTTRQAVCAGCGVAFTSTYYAKPIGWTRYHSRGCGATYARRAHEAAAAATAATMVEAAEAPATYATPATVDPAPEVAPDAAPADITPRTDDTREATCPQCGVVFTSRYRGAKRGWPRFCSAVCGGQAQAHLNAEKAQAAREAAREAQHDAHLAAHTAPDGHVAPVVASHPSAPVTARVLTLPSGAVVTLAVTGNLLKLGKDERDFVFELAESFNTVARMLAAQARQAPRGATS